jgi:hypothetical protein
MSGEYRVWHGASYAIEAHRWACEACRWGDECADHERLIDAEADAWAAVRAPVLSADGARCVYHGRWRSRAEGEAGMCGWCERDRSEST